MSVGSVRPVRVLVVGVPLLRLGLEKLVQSVHARYEIGSVAVRLDEALELLGREPADLAVLVGDALAIADLTEFCRRSPARVVLVTSSVDERWLDQAVIAGVRAVVPTGASPEIFLRALGKVADGELWIPRSAAHRILEATRRTAQRQDADQSKIGTLTVRERETIAAVLRDTGAPGKVVAGRLCISEHTLRNHLTSIYSKLGLANRLDLYAYASRHALFEMR